MCISGEKHCWFRWRRGNCARRPVLMRAVSGSDYPARLVMQLADSGMLPRNPITVITRRQGTHAWCMRCRWFRCDNACGMILLRCVSKDCLLV